ncbi:hypothetical protein ACFO8O_07430 [Hephaestia sp. GCM10023244]|uniref:hypothetical protein n=1 Tax=unclassified Hephaestia TaxID=2631281 RepID=UPI002076DCA0|nr:hypothetical protein [Hephaestia sp. MAHUQ-44]MCM8730798.1 hypothetical protein [Hephaestia sp. MAHUQ-44]
MAYLRQRPTGTFRVVVILLTLWNAFGCYTWYLHKTLGAEAMGPATDYDRQLFAALPDWYVWVYAIAVGAGLLGAIALLARSASALWLFIVSLVAIVAMFGYFFLATDVIAVKGAGATLPFPIVIALVAAFGVWFTGYATRRGWVS